MSSTSSISKPRKPTAQAPIDPNNRGRRWAWIWLAYTGFLFIDPIFQPNLLRWVVSIVAVLIFYGIFALYFRSADAQTPTRFWMIGAMFLLGLIVFPLNQGASCFFIYATSFLPFTLVSLRRILSLFVLFALLVLAEGAYFHAHYGLLHVSWPNTLVAIFLMLLIGGGNIVFAQQRRADCLLLEAQAENVTLAAVAERERIARDLHDVLGHTLSVIVLKAELAGRLLNHPSNSDPSRAASEIADVEHIARNALAEVREAIGGYRSQGLAAEIEAARRTLDAASVTLINDTEAETLASSPGTWAATTFPALTPAEETVLALTLREAVTNIVRHSQATTCRLRFLNENGHRRLLIEDDGHHPLAREGNGLRGMRERVESLGGRFALERNPGTRLLIDLPIHSEAA